MRCPFCADMDTRVIDSRMINEGEQIRRRRQCTQCTERFTSYETAELNLPMIVKVDSRREAFNEAKLRAGILRAIEKRPVATDKAEMAISKIKNKLRAAGEREINSHKLGNWVIWELRQLDKVAYIRFVSVYKNFPDIQAFLDEIQRLENALPPDMQENQLKLLAPDGETN